MLAQGEHANSRQVVPWLGFKPTTPVLLCISTNHLATVHYSPEYCFSPQKKENHEWTYVRIKHIIIITLPSYF